MERVGVTLRTDAVTALSVPGLPVRYVRRPQLEQRIEAGVETGHVLVSAPAGSGKTLLLTGWATARHAPVAWLSLQPEDGDPQRFWSRVLDALRAAATPRPGSLLSTLRASPTHDQRFVRLLVAACEELPAGPVLVLDDLHTLRGTEAMTSISSALRSDLGPLHLVLSTRSDPPIPMQRLRLEGRVTELRAPDLCFDPAEAARLLEGHDVVLAPDQLATVLARTEGWGAGLRLAALSLKAAPDVRAAVAAVAGQQRSVADYFAEEVLDSQDAAMTQFLLDTCVVRHLCGDLADELTGRSDGHDVLAQLERDNLFVVALDERREWYRYHQMFGDLLRHRLRTTQPDRWGEVHRRAAQWHAAQGDSLEAARHLKEAGDWVALSRLVLRDGGSHLLGVERLALVAVLDGVPADVVDQHPEAAAAAAIACYARYDADGVTAHAARARDLMHLLEPRDARLTEAVLATLAVTVGWIEADAARQVSASSEALRLLETLTPAEMPALPVYRIAVTTVRGMGQLWSGDINEAERTLSATVAALRTRDALTPVLALHLHGSLAVIKAMSGRLGEARAEVDTALAVAQDCGWTFLPLSAMTYVAEAMIRLLEADLPGCAAALQRGRACVGDLRDRHAETSLGLGEVRMHVAAGNVAAARRCMHEVLELTSDWPMPTFLARWTGLVEAEILLADDRPRQALDLLRPRTEQPEARPHAEIVATVARALLLDRRPDECLDVLDDLLRDPPKDLGPATDVWLLAALAHDQRRQEAQAQQALARSLEIAESEGILRPFVVGGERVLPLLRMYLRTNGTQRELVERLLRRLGDDPHPGGAPPLAEPLTNRERSVLLFLPTMMSNDEIAEELHLSVNTVKVHLKSLYRKLGVSSRRQAVARSRDLGISPGLETPGPARAGGPHRVTEAATGPTPLGERGRGQAAVAVGSGAGGSSLPSRKR